MEILCKSDYQDLYRIKDGVLLVVNKFDYKRTDEGRVIHVYDRDRKTVKKYNDGCQDQLKVLKREYECTYEQCVLEAGTVLYNGYAVELTSKENWYYQIKTTGDLFSGNQVDILELIDEVKKLIEANKPYILTQYHEDSGNIWQYMSEEPNPCECGSNVYHLEYDEKYGNIYGVCNACDTIIYKLTEEYVKEKLKQGVWK